MRAAWVVLVALGLASAWASPVRATGIGPIRQLSDQERLDDLVRRADAVVVATLSDRVRYRKRVEFGGKPLTLELEHVAIRPHRSLKGPGLPSEVRIDVCPTHPVSEYRSDLPRWPVALIALQRVHDRAGGEQWVLVDPGIGEHPYRALVADSSDVIARVEATARRQSLDSLAIEAGYIGVLRELGKEQVQEVEQTIAGSWPAGEKYLFRLIPIPHPGRRLVFGRLDGESGRIEPLHMGAGEMEIADGIVQPLNQPLDSVILRIRMLRLAHGRPAPRAARH